MFLFRPSFPCLYNSTIQSVCTGFIKNSRNFVFNVPFVKNVFLVKALAHLLLSLARYRIGSRFPNVENCKSITNKKNSSVSSETTILRAFCNYKTQNSLLRTYQNFVLLYNELDSLSERFDWVKFMTIGRNIILMYGNHNLI